MNRNDRIKYPVQSAATNWSYFIHKLGLSIHAPTKLHQEEMSNAAVTAQKPSLLIILFLQSVHHTVEWSGLYEFNVLVQRSSGTDPHTLPAERPTRLSVCTLPETGGSEGWWLSWCGRTLVHKSPTTPPDTCMYVQSTLASQSPE